MSGSPPKRHQFRRSKRSRLWRQNLAREQAEERPEAPAPPTKKGTVRRASGPAEPPKKSAKSAPRRAEPRSDPPEPTTTHPAQSIEGQGADSRTSRRIGFLAMGASALLVAGGVYLAARGSDATVPGPTSSQAAPALPRNMMEVVPRGATIVVTADLRALRSSPLAAPYLGGQSVPGLGDVPRICGFDPIAMVDQIAIAVPEDGEADFGIAAMGGFSDSAMADCARKIVEARGGRSLVSSAGPFRSVRDAASPTAGEIAVKPGLLLWGGGQYLKTMVSTADGTQPGLESDSFHTRMRTELQGYETAQATILLSDSQRANVADEITKAQGRAPVALAFVSGAALGVRLVGDSASLLLIVVADKASQSGEVQAWLESVLADASEGMTAKLLGLTPLVSRIRLSVVGSTVHAELDANVAELETVVDRAMTLRNLLRNQPEQVQPQPQPEPPVPGSATPSASVIPSAIPPSPSVSASASPPAPASSAPKKRKPKPEQPKPQPPPSPPE